MKVGKNRKTEEMDEGRMKEIAKIYSVKEWEKNVNEGQSRKNNERTEEKCERRKESWVK